MCLLTFLILKLWRGKSEENNPFLVLPWDKRLSTKYGKTHTKKGAKPLFSRPLISITDMRIWELFTVNIGGIGCCSTPYSGEGHQQRAGLELHRWVIALWKCTYWPSQGGPLDNWQWPHYYKFYTISSTTALLSEELMSSYHKNLAKNDLFV